MQRDRILSFGKMLFGTLLMAIGVNLFLRPAAVFSGGIPGMAVILLHLIGTNYTAYFGLIVFLLQAIFILVQIPYFGLKSTAKGICTSFSFSIMTQLTLTPCAGIHISGDTLLMAIGGSACLGAGIGIVLLSGFRFVGSLGIAEIISDKFAIPPGTSIRYLDSAIVLCGAFVIGVEQAMISIIGIWVMGQVIAGITRERFQYKKLLIISSETKKIREGIKRELFRDSNTLQQDNTMYRKDDNMLVVVIRGDQSRHARQIVRKEDSAAVIVLSEMLEKGGKGFKRL